MCSDNEQYIASNHIAQLTPGCVKTCNEPDKIKFKPTAVKFTAVGLNSTVTMSITK